MDKGFIVIYRRITDHWLWKEKPFTKGQAFVDLVLLCNHSEQKVLIKNELIICKRGDSLNSLETWGIRWGWNKSKVKRFLELLKKDNMIVINPTHKTTHLSIVNYETYQTIRNGKRNADETQMKHKRNADETQMKLNNNDNHINHLNNDNHNNNIFIAPLNLPSKETVLKTYLDVAIEIFKTDEKTLNQVKANEKAIDFFDHWVGDEISKGAWITDKKHKDKKINLERTIKNHILYIGTNGIKFNYEYMVNHDIPYKEPEPEKTAEELVEIERKTAETKKVIEDMKQKLRDKYKDEDEPEREPRSDKESKAKLNEIFFDMGGR